MKIKGKVVHGKGLGRTVGMPTANIEPNQEYELPKEGVYATWIYVGSERFPSVTNIGKRPSVDDDKQITIEAYILDFESDIYDKTVELEVVGYIRDVKKFDSLKEVQEQVQKDIKTAKDMLK